ncbi:MAG: hypothetical protein NTY08_02145 [Proteobacteria bacterium]|nr:hypothetical protein [Pseudomonadota bacterium]
MANWVQTTLLCLTAYALSTCAQGGGSGIIAGLKSQKKVVEVKPTDPDPTGWSLATAPTAAEIAASKELMAMLVQSGFESASSAAAAGQLPSEHKAGLKLATATATETSDLPVQQISAGAFAMDCYLGSSLQTRGGPLTWPESTDATSVFANSKNSKTSNLFMYLEPFLVQYPEQAPTVSLTLLAPFRFKSMVEDIAKDNRSLTIAVNDAIQTQYSSDLAFESHRFWVAKNAITGQTSAVMNCYPEAGDGAKGASGVANGTYARVKWSDNQQMSGLTVLERFQSSGSLSRTYIPRKKGVLAPNAVTVDTKFGASGYRLTMWSATSSSAAAVPNTAHLRQKSSTYLVTRSEQIVDGNEHLLSDLSHTDQSRPVNPVVVQSHFDASENPLAHVVATGTLHKTGIDTGSGSKWYSSLTFAGITYDLVYNTEPCIPVAGSATLKVFESENGKELRELKIKFSSTALTASGDKLRPEIAIEGDDDADLMQAKWIKLLMNRRCELK